jgi:predicted CopG family antitoxin
MAVKTITIDLEAYDLLAARKREGESFSRALKRILEDEGPSTAVFLRNLSRAALSRDALDRIEESVRDRELDWTDDPEGKAGAR